MRVGLIADIHGNVLALEAVLAELAEERVDEIVCLGDVAFGPQTAEALERIAELRCRAVLGNWDKYVVDGFPAPRNEVDRKLIEMAEWWSADLRPEHKELIRRFEDRVELQLTPRTKMVAVHGSPRSIEEGIFSTTPADEVDRMLAGVDAPLIAAGHTHFAMTRQHNFGFLVNPGSVGLQFSRLAPVMQMLPCTHYAIVDAKSDLFTVALRRGSFDVDAFIRVIRETGVPHADWWARLWTGNGPWPGGDV